MRLFLLLAWCISMMLPMQLHAQTKDLIFEHLSTEQGLARSYVTCIYQDKNGFMWFGTSDGLNRFDGYSFLLFEHDPKDSTSISNNSIQSIYEDRQGNLWIGTVRGLNKLDRRTNTFQVYRSNPNNPTAITENRIGVIYQDHAGTLWIGNYAGLNKFDPRTNGFTLYKHHPDNFDDWQYNKITTIYEDGQRNLWVGTTQGLSLFDRKTHRFTRFPHQLTSDQTVTAQHSVSCILEDRSGALWIATAGDGLLEFNRKTKTFKNYQHDPQNPNSLSSNRILSLREDSFGTLWIGTQDQGLTGFNTTLRKFTHYIHDPKQANSISDNTITSIYEDRSKVLWLGTYLKGINKVDALRKKFKHLKYNPANSNSLYSDYVSTLYEDRQGNVWVGNEAGIDRLDKKSGQFIHYFHEAIPNKPKGDNTTRCIYEDKAGNLWIGLHGGGLKKLNRATNQVTSYVPDATDSTSLPHGIVNTIYQDQAGSLWVGTRYGLARFDSLSQQFSPFKPSFVQTHSFNVTSILEDANGTLWLAAGHHGLHTFNPKTGLFAKYKYKGMNAEESNQAILSLYESRSGVVWMSLEGEGLLYLDRKTGVVQAVTEPRALSKVAIVGMVEDAKGNLWLSTKKNGIYKFNLRTKLLNNYDAKDGLQGNEFLYAICKSTTGELYFGGNNGLNVFHPDNIRSNPYEPPVAITGFKVFDKPRPFSKEIILPYRDNFLSFDFVGLSYSLPEKNLYMYQLEGFDEDWIQSGTRRYASYTNLEPGNYVFRVRASNHDGVWNKNGTAIKLTITPPIWRTAWAYVMYGLLFAGLIVAFQRYTINQEQLKNNLRLKSLESDQLMELDQLKSRFFTNVSHEFRTPLTLILSPLEKNIASDAKGRFEEREVRLMYRNAQRLLDLINQLLDISKLEAKKMQLEITHEDLVAVLKLQVAAFQLLAENKQITLTFTSQHDSLPTLFDQDKLEKIISNLLANAVKFTPSGGQVNVSVSRKPPLTTGILLPRIVIAIEDTGIGIPDERIVHIFDRFYQVDSSHTREFEGTGIGLALTKELVELQNGTIRVTSQVGVGTCFTVELPLPEVKSEMIAVNTPAQAAAPVLVELSQLKTNPEESQPVQSDSEAPLLLVVEDNADLRTYIRVTFQSHYRIAEAADGKEGHRIAMELMPDLVISDWMMPKMDGMQLCSLLKTDERTSHIPIILLTAKTTLQNKLEGLEIGADDYITKPFHADELVIRVKNLITQRIRLRERFSRELQTLPSLAGQPVTDAILAPVLNPIDEQFLQRVMGVIEANMSDSEFSIEMLEREAGMSHVHFNRKLKALTDQTPNEFLRNCRLRRAAKLLLEHKGNVSEVAYQVGFGNLSYFTKCFRQLYGTTPSEYATSRHKLDIT